jgi:hypothetical protein
LVDFTVFIARHRRPLRRTKTSRRVGADPSAIMQPTGKDRNEQSLLRRRRRASVADLTFASAALQVIGRRSRPKYRTGVNWWLVAGVSLVLTFLHGRREEFGTPAAGDQFRRDTILSATIGAKNPNADRQQKRDIWEDQWNAGRFSAE